MNLESLNNTYQVVIGGGGYGVVKSSNLYPYKEKAVKFLYLSECPSAKKEYITNKILYNAWKIFLKCQPVSNFSIVKPYDFVENQCHVFCPPDEYSCAVIMERLFSPGGPEGPYSLHLAFNGVLQPPLINTLVRTRKGIPRGYFYDPLTIQNFLTSNQFLGLSSIEDIIYRMGILDGICIFGSRIVPYDAEYLLTVKNGELLVTLIDFGKFYQFNVTIENSSSIAEEISNHQEYNLYYHPYSDAIPVDQRQSCQQAYKQGMTDAFNCFNDGSPEYTKLYQALMKIYDDLPNY